MHIYLKKGEALESNLKYLKDSGFKHYLGSDPIFDYESTPYIGVSDDCDVVKQRQDLPKCFLRATILALPKYEAGGINRMFGVYKYGKAKAELVAGSNTVYCLRIETSYWEGIADMKTLQEKLWAGSIAPTIAYNNTQRKQHPLQILAQILDSRKLSGWKRFILALRLIKPKPSC